MVSVRLVITVVTNICDQVPFPILFVRTSVTMMFIYVDFGKNDVYGPGYGT